MLKTIAISAITAILVVEGYKLLEPQLNEDTYMMCTDLGGDLFVNLNGGGRCISREVFIDKPRD